MAEQIRATLLRPGNPTQMQQMRLAATNVQGTLRSSSVLLTATSLRKQPALADNAVSLWAGLRLLKRGGSVSGYGRLLRDHLAHESAQT